MGQVKRRKKGGDHQVRLSFHVLIVLCLVGRSV
jgi:hypothetical protein